MTTLSKNYLRSKRNWSPPSRRRQGWRGKCHPSYGTVGPNTGKHDTPETIERKRLAQLKRYSDPQEHVNKHLELVGKKRGKYKQRKTHYTPENIENMRKAKLGKPTPWVTLRCIKYREQQKQQLGYLLYNWYVVTLLTRGPPTMTEGAKLNG